MIEIFLVLLLSSVKFAFAVGYMLANGFNYQKTSLTLLIGGSIGIVIFFYFGTFINSLINKTIKRKKKKVFSKMNRFIVSIKSNYGLIGLSILTPIAFSIPLGCFLVSRFYGSNKLVVPIMLGGVLFWSLILPLINLYLY